MPRAPSMWWRKSHGAWFTTIDRKQYNLGPKKAAAQKEFHALMASRGGTQTPTGPGRLTTAKLADDWLSFQSHRVKASTFKMYLRIARDFIDSIGRLRAADLRPHHVTKWVDSREWNQSTKRTAMAVAKMITAWGEGQGLIDKDPIHHAKKPRMLRRKELQEAELAAFMADVTHPAYLDLVTMSLETGCRPGELFTLEAKDVDFRAGKAKVTGKTGEREIYLSPRAAEILERQAAKYPRGPLLRNTLDEPWTLDGSTSFFERTSKKTGVKVVHHQLRGLFASRMVRKGMDSLTLMKLMGHSSPLPLAHHYVGFTDEQLRKAAALASDSPPPGQGRPDDRPGTPQGPPPPP